MCSGQMPVLGLGASGTSERFGRVTQGDRGNSPDVSALCPPTPPAVVYKASIASHDAPVETSSSAGRHRKICPQTAIPDTPRDRRLLF